MTPNPGIRRTVALLQTNCFHTIESGDGETLGLERDWGYVVIQSTAASLIEETDRLVGVLRANGIPVASIGRDTATASVTSVVASYDPADGTALIDVGPIHDRMLVGES